MLGITKKTAARQLKYPLIIGLCLQCTAAAFALRPENVVVVVNSRSWSSLTIANHYIRLRRIPDVNVVTLDWPGSVTVTDVDSFRRLILQPVMNEIRRRKLQHQIYCITYSSDFPYSIDFSREHPGDLSVGSITGMTYLHSQVKSGHNYVGSINRFADLEFSGNPQPSLRNFFGIGKPHMLSSVLGYTSGRGNSVAEVIRSLTRSSFADGTFPSGTVYFSEIKDIRSRVRSGRFEPTRAALAKLGGKSQTFQAVLPKKRRDVVGAVLGKNFFRWQSSRSRMLPGAICDNFTSFGGVLDDQTAQVPATDLVRGGTSLTTGTVVEPFALPAKFPDPSLHYHYRLGLTSAVSVFRSLRTPYQLLVLGDPLCAPFRNDSVLSIQELRQEGGNRIFVPKSSAPDKTVEFIAYLDGREIARADSGQALAINPMRVPRGYHEFSLLAQFERGSAGGRVITPINSGDSDERSSDSEADPVRWGDSVRLRPGSDGTQRMVFHGRSQVASAMPGSPAVIDTKRTGLGPIRLQLADRMVRRGGSPSYIPAPQHRRVLAPDLIRANRARPRPPQDDEKPANHPSLHYNWTGQMLVDDKDKNKFRVEGVYDAKETGLHQLQVLIDGNAQVVLNGQTVCRANHNQLQRVDVPLNLEKGLYQVRVNGVCRGKPLEIRLGYRGARRIGGL